MELGKGKWRGSKDIKAQRGRFLNHLENYERIFTLRHWINADKAPTHYYELVEIKKSLLMEVANFQLRRAKKTKQETFPYSCTVPDGQGGCKFQLCFDAGTERKLTIRHLKLFHCTSVAFWEFPV